MSSEQHELERRTSRCRGMVAKTEWKSSTVKRAAFAQVKAMFRAAVFDWAELAKLEANVIGTELVQD